MHSHHLQPCPLLAPTANRLPETRISERACHWSHGLCKGDLPGRDGVLLKRHQLGNPTVFAVPSSSPSGPTRKYEKVQTRSIRERYRNSADCVFFCAYSSFHISSWESERQKTSRKRKRRAVRDYYRFIHLILRCTTFILTSDISRRLSPSSCVQRPLFPPLKPAMSTHETSCLFPNPPFILSLPSQSPIPAISLTSFISCTTTAPGHLPNASPQPTSWFIILSKCRAASDTDFKATENKKFELGNPFTFLDTAFIN